MDGLRIDAEWEAWSKENLARGVKSRTIYGELARQGFDPAEIKRVMGAAYPDDGFRNGDSATPKRIGDPRSDGVDYEAFARPRLTRLKTEPGLKRVHTSKLQLYIWDGFLSPAECAALVNGINANLRPSTVTHSNGDDLFRTSRTCDLKPKRGSVVEAIDAKIARALGVNLTHSETMQGQKYQIGQEFKPHTDYFAPYTDEYEKFAGDRGQRTWTFMIYLCQTAKGGMTRFTEIGRNVKPKTGRAVVWNNLKPDGSPNPATQHHAMPVELGEKIVITKWFRDRGLGGAFPAD